MKSSKKNIYSPMNGLTLLLLAALMLAGCEAKDSHSNAQSDTCDTVTEIEGEYTCTGECIITGEDGKKMLLTVSGETDKVQRFPGANKSLYQVHITGGNDFRELEMGALTGRTLRTATAEVSDGQYPVLEEYVFDTDLFCKAVGFTKIVRNPSPELFKTCVIYCKKSKN